MEFQDKVLKCVECREDFVFTAGQQVFFREKQFRNEPKRCKNCKTKVRRVATDRPDFLGRSSRIETHTTCSHCGKDTTVPFRPTQGRPVLCRDCFDQRRGMASA